MCSTVLLHDGTPRRICSQPRLGLEWSWRKPCVSHSVQLSWPLEGAGRKIMSKLQLVRLDSLWAGSHVCQLDDFSLMDVLFPRAWPPLFGLLLWLDHRKCAASARMQSQSIGHGMACVASQPLFPRPTQQGRFRYDVGLLARVRSGESDRKSCTYVYNNGFCLGCHPASSFNPCHCYC